MLEFQSFNKIPRLKRDCIITEKIDGTNAQIYIVSKSNFDTLTEQYAGDSVDAFLENNCLYVSKDNLLVFAGSRKRWLDCSSKNDNYGFAKWVKANAEELLKLGEGRHYGEWYGSGIQRRYGLKEKRLALFNVAKWSDDSIRPKCCEVVPVIAECEFNTELIDGVLTHLKAYGSYAVEGFMNPEGVVIYHKASRKLFKLTCENDEKPKGVE